MTAPPELDRPITLDSTDEPADLVATHDRVLVEFHTEGCSICDAMQPVLGGVARSSDVVVATTNPRENPPLLEKYDVRSVPKLLYFEDGDLCDTMEEGFVPTADVLEFVDED